MNSWRTTGLVLTAIVAAGSMLLAAYVGAFGPAPRSAQPVVRSAASAPPAAVPVAAQPAAPAAVAAASTCPAQPILQARGDGDGQFQLQAALSAKAPTDAAAFVSVAREAASQGRMRDAEVAWIAACHVAERSSGAQSAPVADMKSHMGQHYVTLAAQERTDAARDGLLQRASTLFSESAQAFASALGRNASRTRMAERRLASVREPATLRAALRQPPGDPTATMGAARASSADIPGRPNVAGNAHVLIRSDPELSQMESDLQRLRSQASRVARDPRGMRARDAWALAQRDSQCQDRGCLVRWYAQRRQQLLNEF